MDRVTPPSGSLSTSEFATDLIATVDVPIPRSVRSPLSGAARIKTRQRRLTIPIAFVSSPVVVEDVKFNTVLAGATFGELDDVTDPQAFLVLQITLETGRAAKPNDMWQVIDRSTSATDGMIIRRVGDGPVHYETRVGGTAGEPIELLRKSGVNDEGTVIAAVAQGRGAAYRLLSLAMRDAYGGADKIRLVNVIGVLEGTPQGGGKISSARGQLCFWMAEGSCPEGYYCPFLWCRQVTD